MAGIAVAPFLAPGAERCAFTAELSISVTRGGSAQATRAAKIRCQSPRWLQRFQRLKTVVYGPYSGGKARHRQPSRNRDNAAEHPPIVHAPWPRMHHRQVRLDRRPLYVVQPEQARHDPSFALCQGDPPHRPHVN
jgi:hypothetical protein